MNFNFQLINNALLKETKKEQITALVEGATVRSAWNKGVKVYALELLEDTQEDNFDNWSLLNKTLLNGAINWREYSWGGCSLIYDRQIAERLCNPTELKRTKHGEKFPNENEYWLDVQARALFQAREAIKSAFEIIEAYKGMEV